MRFQVTKTFISGNLKGLTIKEETNVKFIVGKKYCGFGSGYIIDKVEELRQLDCDKYYSQSY